MNITDARNRHLALSEEVRKNDHAYYVRKQPLISDQEYDSLLHELLDLENDFPELISPDSPTQRIRATWNQPSAPKSPITQKPPYKLPDSGADTSKMTEAELREHVKRLNSLRTRDTKQLFEDAYRGLPEHTGFVYAASNPDLVGQLKIGITEGPVEKRLRQLNNTSLPRPFKEEFSVPIHESLKDAERKVHAALDIYRSERRREFFKISVEQAKLEIERVLGSKAVPKRPRKDYPRTRTPKKPSERVC